ATAGRSQLVDVEANAAVEGQGDAGLRVGCRGIAFARCDGFERIERGRMMSFERGSNARYGPTKRTDEPDSRAVAPRPRAPHGPAVVDWAESRGGREDRGILCAHGTRMCEI